MNSALENLKLCLNYIGKDNSRADTVKPVQATTSTTNAESAQANSIQSLLYKLATCLTRPATSLFCFPNEKKPV